MKQHYDVLVIGAGTAGSVVAARLSEDAGCDVCLIEAGDFPSDPDIREPGKWPSLPGRAFDWAYSTVPQPHTANRVHDWPRGRVVGGSSCMHAMAHVRGHRDDFEAWREAGGDRWSYDGLLPGFIRSESFSAFRSETRGSAGPLDVYLPDDEVSPVVRAYIAAGNALGVPQLSDHNSGPILGTSPNSLTIRNGERVSLADAYLTDEVLARNNLTLVTGCEIENLVLDGARATGVVALRDGEELTLTADRIVLSAGSIATPLLLMRSGIGDRKVLRQADINCKIENPEIGSNLQDHLLVLGNVYAARQPVPASRLQHSESLMYLNSADITETEGSPDIVLACVVAPSVSAEFTPPAFGSAFTILCGVTHPTSRGSLRPGGPGRHDHPIIDPKYLDTEYDRTTFRRAFRMARRIGHHEALAEWRKAEAIPGMDAQTDAEIDAFIANAASTHHHPCGTCRMGKDERAVVDPDLRLNGLDNVYVVDASIIPKIPCGPINAAVVAIAETWSALDINKSGR
ncbi:GMC family oxidoreductase [Oricola nitratireducens]|uniref:GMC family oxidoreductase n=1 Tax=Oricola nitratireducens TaxID=2775868 RepID=UPI001865BB55|nr:GMC family oxidoreductase N-terminal domain-containing protein [Oricola nitratireducens]